MATARVRDTLDISTGTPYYKAYNGVIGSPNEWQTLIEDTVPDQIIRNLQRVVISCRIEGKFIIMVDGEVIGSGRTGGAQSVVPFDWIPARKISAGKIVKILFCSRPNLPTNTVDLEAYMQASDSTV